MSVTTKFAIVFLLPFLIAISLMLGGVHYFYGITQELFLDLIPALISTAAVVLLVWERLRGSLRGDLAWFHHFFLFKLYNEFKPKMDLYHIRNDPIRRVRANLEEYGRSILRLRLYPGKLPEMLDKFLELNKEFSPKLEKLEEWGQKEGLGSYGLETFLYFLGIEPELHTSPSYTVEEGFRAVAQEFKEKQPELVPGIIDLLQKMEETREQIHDLLDDFIKDNKLRLERERFYIPRP